MRAHALSTTLVLLAAGAPATGQSATVLLKVGDALPGGLTVTKINQCDVNRVGGYVTLAVATDAQGIKRSLAWGSPDGVAPPAVLFQEGLYQGLQQTSWYAEGGFDDAGRIGYRSTATGPGGAVESVWHQDVPLAVEGDPSTLPGSPPWGLFQGAGLTDSGMPWFYVWDVTEGGVFVGPGATPLYASGDPVPGLPQPVWLCREPAFSSDAAHHLVDVVMETAGDALVLDGVGLVVGASLLQTGTPLDPALGGDGIESWTFFEELAVSADASWSFSAQTLPAPVGANYLVVSDGAVAYRDGDVVDGATLPKRVLELDRNDRGELLHVWGNITAPLFFVDGDLLVQDGDPVDFDGDGQVDPANQVSSVGVVAPARLSEDGWVYFRAGISGAGPSDVESFLRISRAPAPLSYCTPKLSSSGCAAAMRTGDPTQAPVAGANDYSILCTGVEGLRNGLLFWGVSGPAAIPFLGGTLCVLPPLNRTPIQFAGGTLDTCNGGFALALNDPAANWNLGPGQSAWWQAWYRDPELGDGFDVALSNGIEVVYR